MGQRLRGRRRMDSREGELPENLRVGDYWLVLDRSSGLPLKVDHPSNLTGTAWHVACPNPDSHNGEGFLLANLRHHTVREHPDGTISVRPGDGSSNSILVSHGADGPCWHGYIEHGELLTLA